jgi:hypothetical protein
MGIVMCLTGLTVGIWRYALTPRFRKKHSYSHSPYSGWMKWHHYAGLIFGLVTFTWIFSGAVDVPAIPGIDAFGPSSNFTKTQLALGARSPQGAGATIDLEPITLERLRDVFIAINSVFAPKELEFLQVGSKPYFIAYKPPASQTDVDNWTYRTNLDFLTPLLDKEHVLVSITNPERGAFRRFDDDSMLQIAKAAMPNVPVKEATWLSEFDDYYYYSVPSFNLGLMKPVRTLPVLRLAFADDKQTRIYMSPSHGQMLKSESNDRVARWSLYGLHALDFSFLYQHRPLWDIVVWTLLIGSTILSSTTLVPMFRRLKRHAGRLKKALAGRRAPRPQTVPSERRCPALVTARNYELVGIGAIPLLREEGTGRLIHTLCQSPPCLVPTVSAKLAIALNSEWRSRHAVHRAIRRQTGSGGTAPEIDAATLGLPG